jgi:formate transporter
MSDVFGSDAYAPQEIAARISNVGVVKARLPWLTQALLGMLAGAFIGLGALMFTLVASDTALGFAASRLLGGLVFSLGLVLVIVAGAELFTGNNLIAMAWPAATSARRNCCATGRSSVRPTSWGRRGWRCWWRCRGRRR